MELCHRGLNARGVANSDFGPKPISRKRFKTGLPRFQNLLLIVYDHINTICAIIQRLFEQNKL